MQQTVINHNERDKIEWILMKTLSDKKYDIASMICNKNLCHNDVAPKAQVIIVDCKDVTAAKISNVFCLFLNV